MSPLVKQFLRQLLASGTDSVRVYQVRRVGFGAGFHFEGKGNICYILLTGLNCFQQETSKEISLPGPAINENVHAKHFLPGPGKQELYEGSGVYRKCPCISHTFFTKLKPKIKGAAYPWIHL